MSTTPLDDEILASIKRIKALKHDLASCPPRCEDQAWWDTRENDIWLEVTHAEALLAKREALRQQA